MTLGHLVPKFGVQEFMRGPAQVRPQAMAFNAATHPNAERQRGQALPPIENVLLRLLPREEHPVLLRYSASAGIVSVAALLRYSMEPQLQHYPILLFFPAVFLCALLFDKGSGFFATILSAIVSAYVFMEPRFSFAIASEDIIALAIFVVVGFTMAGTTEDLRKTVEQLSRAEQSKSLLLDELAHRTKNDLAIIGSAISLQARASENPKVREALDAAKKNARVQVVAAAQSKLRASQTASEIELAEYLQELCTGLGDVLRGVRPIAVRVHCPPVRLRESTAVAISLIVNELVTNSLKYAFPTERGGIVDVHISSGDETGLVITVKDNGDGCPQDAAGLGTRLVRLLAKQRGGHFERTSSDAGCQAVAIIADLS